MVASSFKAKAAVLALLAGSAVASLAQAQSMTTNSAGFNAGYGRVAGSENHIADYGTRDANGNRVIVDGIIQTGEDQSYFGRVGGGVGGTAAGVGGLGNSSSAIGNNLVVVTQGSWNTVIIDSTQINNGNVSAGSDTDGGVGGN